MKYAERIRQHTQWLLATITLFATQLSFGYAADGTNPANPLESGVLVFWASVAILGCLASMVFARRAWKPAGSKK